MVVVLDCIMTFFGSTAYDACFNAWTTDISDDSSRGRIAALVQLAPLGAQVILAAAGLIVDRFGYHFFFTTTGIIVSICGWITGHFIQDSPDLKPSEKKESIFLDILNCFSASSFRENRKMFLLLGAMCIFLCGFQVVYAYEMIYANQYLGIAKTWASLLNGAALPVMVLGSLWTAAVTDKGKAWSVLWLAPALSAAGSFLHASAHGIPAVLLGRALFYGGYMIMNTAVLALFKELEPAESRGRFEGVRMVFMVLMPMIIGPSLGSLLIERYGLSPHIYMMAGFVGLCTYILLFILKRQR